MKRLSPSVVVLAVLLIALQALAPFLHAHIGAWRVGGLHVDGQYAVYPSHPVGLHAADADRDASSEQLLVADEPESPAIGVAAGLREEHESIGWLPLVLAWVACALWPAVAAERMTGRRFPPPFPVSLIPRLRPPNGPPPASAPPIPR